MGMYEEMMAHDLYRDPMMMREMEMMMRHHPHMMDMMDSDDEDDYPMMGMGSSSRGFPRKFFDMFRSKKGNSS
jgi:diadenosine tetraphosphatase ApaH/serine/threonine PP2A family protein phosphatase